MNIVLAPDGPLHAGATLARYHLWGEDPANRLADGALLRVLRRHGRLVPYEVRPTGSVDDARLMVRIARARDAATGEAVAAEVRQIFGLAFDLSGFYRMAKGDPVLAALVEPLYGMRPALAAAPSEVVIERLTRERGLGRWTADWFLARCLGRGDVCPAGDLGVRRAFEHFYGRARTRSEEAIRRRARAWGEHQSLAIHYLLAGMRLERRAAGGGA